ncbi:MAG: hypothetical protein Rubg2KO_25590 [Rubricoccaceae bacterium]
MGGYDTDLKARILTDLLFRLNPVCSILGVPVVGYRHLVHDGPRLSNGAQRRQICFDELVDKHEQTLRDHPRGFATLLFQHAITMWRLGERRLAVLSAARAATFAPLHTCAFLGSTLLRGTSNRSSLSNT